MKPATLRSDSSELESAFCPAFQTAPRSAGPPSTGNGGGPPGNGGGETPPRPPGEANGGGGGPLGRGHSKVAVGATTGGVRLAPGAASPGLPGSRVSCGLSLGGETTVTALGSPLLSPLPPPARGTGILCSAPGTVRSEPRACTV